MRDKWQILKEKLVWLFLLLVIDGFSVMLLWLADTSAFYATSAVILLASLLLFTVVCGGLIYHEGRKEQAFINYMNMPDTYHEELLRECCSVSEQRALTRLADMLASRREENSRLCMQVSDYETYVETWAHETKTPLSLLTLLLDNHRREIAEPVCIKLDFVRSRMQESVDQMLFYARLKSVKKDYLFEQITLSECISEVLADYRPLLDEKNILVSLNLGETAVYSDRRGLIFLISQIISNAIKYSDSRKTPHIEITCALEQGRYLLGFADNGIGMNACDLPYIFEKGFTGDSADGRRKATGMGLYLAKMIAADMQIELAAEAQRGESFVMKVVFPVVE